MTTSVDIRLPNITGASEREQLTQIRSYLYSLAEQLRWALNVDDGGGAGGAVSSTAGSSASSSERSETEKLFANLKALIISSGEIIEAYAEAISKKLEGVYVAESDFGTFREETTQTLNINSTAIEQLYEELQSVITEAGDETYYVSANIRTGLLDYDSASNPIYGIEVGQKNGNNFRRYARFTADELAFYNGNGTKVAWISGQSLHITNAEITNSLKLGKFMLNTSDGLTLKYVGS